MEHLLTADNMNKTLIIGVFATLSLTACKNQSETKESSEIKIENTLDTDTNADSKTEAHVDPQAHSHAHANPHAKSHSHEYLYKSDTGEIVEVTFYEEDNTMLAKIKRDGKEPLVLDQTTAWSKGAEYEKENYKWASRNNEATFSDGKETMKLVVISPLQYIFTNTKEDLIVIYFSKNDKRFASIKKEDDTAITLEQTSAWAKGANYGTGAIQWRGEGSKGILIEDGAESEYHQKGI